MEMKKLPAPVVIPPEVEELSRQIERWRSNRPRLMAMPEPLWAEAANLAKQYSAARIARFLRLDYYSLKERMEGPGRDNSAQSEKKPAFIELQALPGTPVSECIIELQHSRGSRIRIQVKGAAMADLTTLSRTLWGMKG